MKLPWQADLPLWAALAEPPRAETDADLRRILLGDQLIHYRLRRARRRTIGLTIDQRGLRVGAPTRASLAEVEALLRKHADWVVAKLDVWKNRPVAEAAALFDGLHFPLLGASACLRLQEGRNRSEWSVTDGDQPLLTLTHDSAPAITRLFEKALCARAATVFAERLAAYCSEFSITPPPLRLTAARTRWGSCSNHSGIRLNWRLIHAPLRLVDYVVAHELAHLKQMNHTPAFWSEVERMYPEWRAARAALREFGRTLPRYV